MPRGSQRTALTVLGTVGAVGAAAAVWGIGIERYLFTVREHDLAVLPPGSPSVSVLHLSDAHMAPWQHRKQDWIAGLERLAPDLIVNTGDNMGHPDGLRGLRAAFDAFRGVPGVFVHGSNDHAAPSPRNPLKYFSGPSKVVREEDPLDTTALDSYLGDELGWLDLNNAVGSLEVAGLRIDTFGVSDAHRGWDRLEVLPDLLAAQRSTGSAAITLGVSHAPYRRVLDAFTGFGADVILAGHTHGGQVRIPGSRSALVANCDIPLDQARGLSSWTHQGRTVPLNVSAGLGHSIYAPVRFGCRPEASLITLRAGRR
ncbi:putative MPP superfamily phosphohydrolase [Microbacterium terrae]|uniref:Phosphodiesterase YaeI n=1 Tax=Microbacterium terrae TaxID=69369 RepID=A0A0M2GWA8_9MICO|nr:metallophosphoesterase [Microbacterium terrae]KJL37777.1 phosphodiesterase YaeI [Microbacterium terrae]MBP1076609.1 putative MPP superfamily phosphohydrolase [Microbacterium terrae]GLJ97437.1 metallophosphoesterase [Microbacterium terrae]